MKLDEITRESMSTLNRIFDDLRAFLLSANTNNNQKLRFLQECLNAWLIRCKRSVTKVFRSAKACSDCFHCWRACFVATVEVAVPALELGTENDPLFLTTSQRG